MFALFNKLWIPLLLSVVIAVGAYAVIRVRDTFGASAVVGGGAMNAGDIKPFNPKRVSYEIAGVRGGTASINYLDENEQSHRVDAASLPWSFTIVTTLPSMSENIVAQANTDVRTLRCRVIVDGQLRDDRSSTGYQPFIYCLVKSV